ncbi:RpiB/LacA/LacB family sugar-phosphate isomerase [Candidatus Parcubacteria bacterium]|nr:RpiB/LacA/LacB family sugar-phosphate isomerase [Candidatus Parcubacteria bacterium]
MKIYIGSDHAGFELKGKLVSFLKEKGYEVADLGAHTYDGSDDYPDYIVPVVEAVTKDRDAMGVVLGGSGQGEAMVGNRHAGVRTALYYGGNQDIVRLAREHNDANILSLGARFLSETEAMAAVLLFIQTEFSADERHRRRIAKF